MRLLLLSFVLLASTMVNAQSFRVGPTVRALYTSPTDDARSGWGVEAGVTGEMNFNKDNAGLFVDASLLFNNSNWKSGTYYMVDSKTSSKYDYSTYNITVPVNIGYRMRLTDAVSLQAAAGPCLLFGLSAKCKEKSWVDGSANKKTEESDNLYGKSMQRVQCGLGVALGAELFKHYQLNVRYNWGLTDTYKADYANGKNNMLSIGLSYLF